MDIDELKKLLWRKYVLAKMFTNEEKNDWLEHLMPEEKSVEMAKEPMAALPTKDIRFKALRDKLQQRQEQQGEDVNAETGRTES